MKLKELEKKYEELGVEIEKLKKEEEFTYPIYKRYIANHPAKGMIVKFTSIEENGEVVLSTGIYKLGEINNWTPPTDTNVWEDVTYDEERGLFDKQLVWVWDNGETHVRTLKFYNAKNRCTFSWRGKRNGIYWDNYEPYEGEYPKWAKEAYRTLED